MSAVATIDRLLAAQTLWHAGRAAAVRIEGEPTGHAALDALLPQRGWPRRALTELLLPADGMGELSLLLPTLARCTRAGAAVAVVAPPYVPYAPAWQAAGVDLAYLQIVDATPRDALWAFEQCLRSGACAAVLGWPAQADARALRRLQVAADSGECLGFALRDRRHVVNPSPAPLRIEAVRAEHGGVAWRIRKCRGGNPPARSFALPRADASESSRHALGDDAAAVRGNRAQARSLMGRPVPVETVFVGAAMAATAPGADAEGESNRAQARSLMGRPVPVETVFVGAAMAANAPGADAEGESNRAQARSHMGRPVPVETVFVGAAMAANAPGADAGGESNRAQVRSHMGRPVSVETVFVGAAMAANALGADAGDESNRAQVRSCTPRSDFVGTSLAANAPCSRIAGNRIVSHQVPLRLTQPDATLG